MRTRIALVASIPIALITVSTLTSTAIGPSTRAVPSPPHTTSAAAVVAMPSNQLAAYHGDTAVSPVAGGSSSFLDPSRDLLSPDPDRTAVPAVMPSTRSSAASSTTGATPTGATAAPASVPPTAATGPVDTVTPAQRAAWERVALCEEGGNWASSGSRFSGGLGITRENWTAYGGQAFAPVGAMATEDQQIMVAERIQYSPPDQSGCGGW